MNYQKILLVLILLIFALGSYGADAVKKSSDKKANGGEKDAKKEVKYEDKGLAEKYLAKKVTISEDSITVADLLDKISKATGVTLVAGIDNDWRVRERKVRIFAYEAYLSHVMYSIADVTKFQWLSKDEDTYILTYRDDTDALIASLEGVVADARMSDKLAALDDLLDVKSGEDMTEMRDKEPIKYLMRSTGLDRSFSKSLKSTPGLYESIVSGQKRTFKGDEIASDTISGIKTTNAIVANLAKETLEARGMNRQSRAVDRFIPKVNDDSSNTEITVNEELPAELRRANMPTNMMGTFMDGYAVVRENGKIVSAIPIVNSRSAVANKVARVLNDLIEKSGLSFQDAFASIMNSDTLADLARDLSRYDDVYRMPVPYNPAFNTIIDLKVSPTTLPEALDLFAAATSTSVFCDDFPPESKNADALNKFKKRVNVRQVGTVYEVLGDICNSFDLNAEYVNNHFDFSSIRWFDYIKNLVSIEYMDKWAEEYKSTGTLSFATLRDMGNYSDTQISTAFTQKEELRPLIGTILANHNALEMLAKVDEDSYNRMYSETGANSAYLSRTSYGFYKNLYQISKVVNRTNTSIRLRGEQKDSGVTYILSFTALDNGDVINIKFDVPKYGTGKDGSSNLSNILPGKKD